MTPLMRLMTLILLMPLTVLNAQGHQGHQDFKGISVESLMPLRLRESERLAVSLCFRAPSTSKARSAPQKRDLQRCRTAGERSERVSGVGELSPVVGRQAQRSVTNPAEEIPYGKFNHKDFLTHA
jgi:hypothetical protein